MANDTGRLLKKTDKLVGTIEVEGYNWLNFNERSHIYPDNSRKSVLMVDYHDPKILNEKVKNPDHFFDKLLPKANVLIPVDLQKDYVLSQREMLIKKRRRMLDEEEAIAEELAELVLEEEEMAKANEWNNKVADKSAPTVSPTAKDLNQLSSEAHLVPESAQTHQAGAHANDSTSHHGVHGQNHPAHAQTMAAEIELLKEEARSRGFEEGRQEGFDTGFRDGHEQGFSDGINEGTKTGFQAGYQDGEGKGLLAAESKSQTFFQKIGESVVEIENLRSEVLAAGQDIFIEITKIASEKLLRTQIATDATTLKNIYVNALETYRDREFVTFEMNPADAKRLKEQFAQMKSTEEHFPKIKIRENPEFASGDFKMEVDSELAVHDLKKSLDSLIDEVSKQIFTNHKKVDKVS